MPEPEAAVPVTLVSGFLGAGKTTLLNHLLRAVQGRRLAVLVNDFGAVNVDAALIERVEGDTVALTNGCICCTRRDDLVEAVLTLLERPDLPEHIVIEASGVSDPWAIAGTLRLPTVRPLFRLDSVITVVDAEQATGWMRVEPEALVLDQIRAANLLVLNKIDAVGEVDRAGVRTWLQAASGGAPVLEATYGQVSADLVLGPPAFAPPVEHAHQHQHQHGAAYQTWSFRADRPVRSLPAIQYALQALPASILRAKGWLYLRDLPDRRVVVQMVGRRIDFEPGSAWSDEKPHTQLVVIGTPSEDLEEGLHRLLEEALVG